MTALIGGSILLIVVASVSLIMGWAGANEPLIYTSIVSSVASFVCLALAYYRSKSEARNVVAAAEAAEGVARVEPVDEEPRDEDLIDTTGEHEVVPLADAEPEADALGSTQAVPLVAAAGDEQEADEQEADEPPAEAAPPEAAPDEVVAFAQRRRYHRPACRYAGASGGERISKEAAEARGYDACRLCKP